VVTLTANPDPGGTFVAWGGDCSGNGDCTLIMNTDKNVSASFSVPVPSDGGRDGGSTQDGGGIDAGTPQDGGGAADGGSAMDGGAADDGGAVDAGSVVNVVILAPDENAVVSGTFNVLAQITSSGQPLDAARLEADLAGMTGPRLVPVPGVADNYSGSVATRTLTSGAYSLVVRGVTLDGQVGLAARRLIVNAGPIIDILRPVPSEPTKSQLTYDFTVRIAPELSSATIGSVTASIGSCAVTLPAPTVASGIQRYSSSADLTACNPALGDGEQQFRVTATDSSSITAVETVTFIIDRKGPDITILSPTASQISGGIVNVTATVTDPSGVAPGSVFATISHGGTSFTFPLDQDPVTMDNYTSTFDTRRFGDSSLIQYPAVEVQADDILGNHSTTGGLLFTIDTVPPVGDLDPPLAEIFTLKQPANPNICSVPFDPVGTEAVDDLQIVPQVFSVRAEVYDRGNAGVGAPFGFYSGVDFVTFYMLDDTSRPLVVDTDGDGICDSINPAVIAVSGIAPGPSQAVALKMVQVPAGGTPDNEPTLDLYAAPNCQAGTDMGPPKPLCRVTNLTIAIQDFDSKAPLIWTLPPVVANDLECLGLPFDALANHIADGWACAAIAFADKAGNHSVSRPLRLCINKSGDKTCPDPGPAPNCTGTMNPTTGVVNPSVPCTARTIPQRQTILKE
jgi:hypothetical protein